MSSPLSDKTIFITGSGGVLGTAYVNTMLENGATVVASDLPGHRAETMKERFGTYANFAYYDLDVGSEEEIEAIFKTLQNKDLFGCRNKSIPATRNSSDYSLKWGSICLS